MLNAYLCDNRVGGLAREIACKSGLRLSVQASSSHYCSPRNDVGPFSEVEVGFPNRVVQELLPFAEDAEEPTRTVYAWVPVDLVERVIADNGGIA